MYRYRCGVCRTISDHLHPFEAEDEQRRHIDSVHDGRTPEQQSITPVDAPPTPRPFALYPPTPKQPQYSLTDVITHSKLSLTVTILVVGFIGWGLYYVLSGLATAMEPHPFPVPTGTPVPLFAPPTSQP
ncbi:hypothetical protein ACIGW6_38680, partial [Kitasatospora aureofaciens]